MIKPWLSHTLSICSPPLLADAIRNLIMHYPKFRSNETKKKKNGFEVQLWSIIRPRGKFNRSNSRARVHIYIVYRVFPLPRNPRIRGWIARALTHTYAKAYPLHFDEMLSVKIISRHSRERADVLEKFREFHFSFSRYLCKSLLSSLSRMGNVCLIVVIIRWEYQQQYYICLLLCCSSLNNAFAMRWIGKSSAL